MEKYTVRVTGKVTDTTTDFRCGFDVTIENGGSLSDVGGAMQLAIDAMKVNGTLPNIPGETSKE